MRIVFFGTSSFAARILASLLGSGHCVVAIVTRPDRIKGRDLQPSPPPVKETALSLCPEIPVFQPEKASVPEFALLLTKYAADLFVVVAYGEIIKENILKIPKQGCINIHASLLPKFRGAAPIQRCLMAGEKQTGIAVIEMTPQMDAGDIIVQESIPIGEEMTFGDLEPKLCDLSAKLLFKAIDDFANNTVIKVPQNHALATLAPKLKPEEEQIDWSLPAEQIHNQIRALSPHPSAWCQLAIGQEFKRLKIKRAKLVPTMAGAAGSILCFDKNGWIVACGEGAIELTEVQLEGKKTMLAADCMRGIHLPIKMEK